MAEGFFNKFSGSRSRGISAGTTPTKEVNPMAIEVMSEVGIDIRHHKPKIVAGELIFNADRIFTMGCYDACPSNLPKKNTEDWGIDDPDGMSIEKFREVRDIIRMKVEELMEHNF